jgi:hypothetical protein
MKTEKSNLPETEELNIGVVMRCYYDDDWCSGKVMPVNTFHKYLCERCSKENDSIAEDSLDHDFSISQR